MIKKVLFLAAAIVLSGCKSTQQVSSVSHCDSFDSCVASISTRVHENAKWICDQHSNDKIIRINVLVSRSGQLEQVKVIQPSADEEFNSAAIKSVQNSAPFHEVAQMEDSEYQDASDITFTFVGNITND